MTAAAWRTFSTEMSCRRLDESLAHHCYEWLIRAVNCITDELWPLYDDVVLIVRLCRLACWLFAMVVFVPAQRVTRDGVKNSVRTKSKSDVEDTTH